MGQYYYVVNLDKKQFLHPNKLGDRLELMGFGDSRMGVMLGLAILLSDGNGKVQDSGDFCSDHPLVGSWAGDRIVISGNYAEKGIFNTEHPDKNLYHLCKDDDNGADTIYTDISIEVRAMLFDDMNILEDTVKYAIERPTNWGLEFILEALELNRKAKVWVKKTYPLLYKLK